MVLAAVTHRGELLLNSPGRTQTGMQTRAAPPRRTSARGERTAELQTVVEPRRTWIARSRCLQTELPRVDPFVPDQRITAARSIVDRRFLREVRARYGAPHPARSGAARPTSATDLHRRKFRVMITGANPRLDEKLRRAGAIDLLGPQNYSGFLLEASEGRRISLREMNVFALGWQRPWQLRTTHQPHQQHRRNGRVEQKQKVVRVGDLQCRARNHAVDRRQAER